MTLSHSTLVQAYACARDLHEDRDRVMGARTASSADLDTALRALADGNRRPMLVLVRDQAGAVGEIAERVGMSQQAVSHHLRVLRGAGLVSEQREGTRHLFRVRTDGLRGVEGCLDGLWPTHLTALKRAAETESGRSGAGGRRDG